VSAPSAEFELCGVVHLLRPTGRRARDLEELRLAIADAPARSLFCHTRQVQLRDPASAELPADDFSAWVNGVVQDRETAERLSFVVQSHGGSPEEQRSALLEVLGRIPESERLSGTAPLEGAFVFLTVESVPLSTGVIARTGKELVDALVEAEPSVWFYHLTEQPWFPAGRSMLEWLFDRGDDQIGLWLREDAAAGLPIEAMRRRLLRRWRRSRMGRRLGEAATVPEDMRREAGRAVVAGFVRRMKRPENAS
jgi:hypothetical protein